MTPVFVTSGSCGITVGILERVILLPSLALLIGCVVVSLIGMIFENDTVFEYSAKTGLFAICAMMVYFIIILTSTIIG